MAKMIGRTKSWAWGVAGLLCALAFGRASAGDEGMATVKYGVRPMPGAEALSLGADERRRVELLVSDYAEPSVEPNDEQSVEIGRLVADFRRAAPERREEFAGRLAAAGAPALPALRSLARGSDAASKRARKLVEEIEESARAGVVAALREVPGSARLVVSDQLAALSRRVAQAKRDASEAQGSGDSQKAREAREDIQAAKDQAAALRKLQSALSRP